MVTANIPRTEKILSFSPQKRRRKWKDFLPKMEIVSNTCEGGIETVGADTVILKYYRTCKMASGDEKQWNRERGNNIRNRRVSAIKIIACVFRVIIETPSNIIRSYVSHFRLKLFLIFPADIINSNTKMKSKNNQVKLWGKIWNVMAETQPCLNQQKCY